jgi:hypothetical protein
MGGTYSTRGDSDIDGNISKPQGKRLFRSSERRWEVNIILEK